MKKITNKKTNINHIKDGKEQKLNYSNFLFLCLNSVDGKGLQIEEMRQNIKIGQILEKNEKEIILEDNDFEYIKGLVNKMSWKIRHIDIIAFVDYINSIK